MQRVQREGDMLLIYLLLAVPTAQGHAQGHCNVANINVTELDWQGIVSPSGLRLRHFDAAAFRRPCRPGKGAVESIFSNRPQGCMW